MAEPSFEELLNSGDSPALPQVGDVIEGTVISVSKTEVHLDINGVATGVIRGRELYDESGEYSNLKLGEKAKATVLELENEYGEMELSFGQAGHKKAWDELIQLMRDKTPLEVPVLEANKGGLMVKVNNVIGFLPVSQLTPEHYPRVEGGDRNQILEILKGFENQKLKVKVLDVDERDEKLIVSEKAAWEEKQQEVLSGFAVGQVVKGKVTGVVDFGCFVEFGAGLEGLVHISELAWQRVDNPHEFKKVGDEVEAKIIGIEGTKISLSIKQLVDDPWKKAAGKYKIGEIVKGKVLKINPFGAFVELDPQIHGLAHISELSRERISSPADVLKEGETREFKILSIEPNDHRLGLSVKALTEPTEEEKAKEEAEKQAKRAKKEAADAKVKKDEEPKPQTDEPAENS